MADLSRDWDFKFDPPAVHELCDCEACHDEGCHEDIEVWSQDCGGCEVRLSEAVAAMEYCLTHHEWYCEKEAA